MDMFSTDAKSMLGTNRVHRMWVKIAVVVGIAIGILCYAMLMHPATALTGGDTFEFSITSASKLYANTSSGGANWEAVSEKPVPKDASLKLRIAFDIGDGAASNGSTLQYRLPNSVHISSEQSVKGDIYAADTLADPLSKNAKRIGSYTVENGVLTASFDDGAADSAANLSASGSSSSAASGAANGAANDAARDTNGGAAQDAATSSQDKDVAGYLDLNLDFGELQLNEEGVATIRLSDSVQLQVASVVATDTDSVSSPSAAKVAVLASGSAASDATTTATDTATATATGTGTDFTQYLTEEAGVQKFVDGKWTNVTEVTEGDTVRVILKYRLPENTLDSSSEAGRTIYYQLPAGITPDKVSSGRVTDSNKTEIGSYTVGTDGKVVIVFDKSAIESESGAIEGALRLMGMIDQLSNGDSGTYNLGGGSKTITIKKRQDEHTSDLEVEKSQPTISDDKTVALYTVKLSSTNGTGGENVYFSDSLTGTNASPDFAADSVTVVKVDALGSTSTVTDFEKKWQTGDANNKYRFDTTLPALAAGEHYEITYKVNINANASSSSVNVSNTADGRTDHIDRTWDTKSFGWGTSVAKSGWYNQYDNTIHWDIRVDPHGGSIVGQKVSDILPDGLKLTGSYYVKGDDGTMLVNAKGSNGAAGDTSIDFTFPSTMDTGITLTGDQAKQAYTISFDTTAPAGNRNVTNSATGTDTSGKTSTSQGGVYVVHRTYDVSKTYTGDEASRTTSKDRHVKWTSTITLPDTSLVDFEYTDTIENATDGNGADRGADSHYAIVSELEKYLATEQHLAINLSDGSQYVYRGYKAKKDHVIKNGAESATDDVDITVTYFDANGNEVTPDDANYSKHIKSFKVSVTVAKGVDVIARNMQITDYQTYLTTSTGTAGDTWTARNKGEINGKTSDATHACSIPKMFDKSVRTKTGNAADAFTSGSANINLDSLSNQLEYRLLLNTDASTGNTIQVTDTLPAGMDIVDGSVYARFFVDSYTEHNTNWAGTTFVDGANSTSGANPTYTATKNNDGTTTVVFTISDYHYTSSLPVVALHYKTTVGNDSYWNSLSNLSKTYENKASWNGYTDSSKTIVTREIQNVEKSGEQLEDSKGNPQNIVRYYVDINPAAKDLVSTSDVLTLTDTFNDASLYSPELLMETVHLYAYDASAKNHKGAEIDPSCYSLMYDSSTATMTVKIPDKLACVLQYDYRIDEDTLSSSNTVTNSVSLNGSWSTANSMQLKDATSSATATHRSIKLYKVDADNYRMLLSGATFQLDKWDSSSKSWQVVNGSETTGDDGTLSWDLVGSASKPAEIKTDTLYRLTETVAPEGYAKDATPHYFICCGSNSNNDTAWANADGSSASVSMSDTTFINYSGGALYISNTYTRLTVTKKWAKEDGSSMDAPSGVSVKVQLYRHKQMADPDDTCTVTLTYKGDESNPWYLPGGTITQNVKRGTAMKFTVSGWNVKYNVAVGGDTTSYENNNVASSQISVPSSATQGSALNIVVQETDSTNAPGVTLDEYTAPGTVVTSGTAYGDPVTLQNGTWSYSWDNLPSTDASGNTLCYTVEEEGVTGYTTTYTNNDGVHTGNITVTNTEQGYTLPKTGGPGSQVVVGVGATIAAIAAVGLVWYRRFRRSR